MSRHFSASETCRRVVDSDGNTRDYWSLHTYRANTLIGQTIGRICNGFAAWNFKMRHSDPAPLVLKDGTQETAAPIRHAAEAGPKYAAGTHQD